MSATALEVAKLLKLVAPISMDAQAQLAWLATAVDSLEGIHAHEISAISLELRRSITRPAQIVPEIARLVSERRKSANRAAAEPADPLVAIEMLITEEAQKRRGRARNQDEVEAAWKWERSARADASLAVPPIEKPFTEREIANMPAHIRQLGIGSGFLKRDGDRDRRSDGSA
jgi:hypothetical protein